MAEKKVTFFQGTASNQNKMITYRPEIDGLRAFAVIAVIINHFNQNLLPNGYLGVDVFFVISGFVITSSLMHRSSKNFSDFLVGFYVRRIKRLIPPLVVCIILTSVLICLFNPQPDTTLKTGITALFGFSNLYLFNLSTDYFASSTKFNVFTHTWSLGVEGQFYLLFPFLVWFTGFNRFTIQRSKVLFWTIGIFSIASLILFIYLYPINPSAAYFLMPTRFWEMGVGCLLFLGLARFEHLTNFLMLPWLPLFLIIALVAVLFLPLKFAVLATILGVSLTLLLMATLRPGTSLYPLFSHPKIVYIGVISYSLYLWHWSVLSLSRWTIGIHWWSIPLQVIGIFLISVASYQYVENPLRHRQWSVVPWKSLVYGLAILAGAAALLFSLTESLATFLYTGQPSPLNQWTGGNTPLSEQNCFEQGDPLSPQYQSTCSLPSRSGQTILAIGDSQTGQLIPLLAKLNEREGIGVTFYARPTFDFPSVPQQVPSKVSLREWKQSDATMKQFLAEQLPHLKKGDIILLSSRWELRWSPFPINKSQRNLKFTFYDDQGNQISKSTAFELWIKEFENLLEAAKQKGISVVAFAPTPVWEELPPSLLISSWFNALNSYKDSVPLEREFMVNHFSEINFTLDKISRSNPNFRVFYPLNTLCPPALTKCNPRYKEVMLYRDESHLNNEGSLYLYPDFKNFLLNNHLLKDGQRMRRQENK